MRDPMTGQLVSVWGETLRLDSLPPLSVDRVVKWLYIH